MVIAQDPFLFTGTIRDNLDPTGVRPDEELWNAVDKSGLKTLVAGLGGLDSKVSKGMLFCFTKLNALVLHVLGLLDVLISCDAFISGGDNFSAGQRQLVCLARAILRRSRIIILDEATASVDVETDVLMQKTIRSEFANRTIVTIAHRLNTILDSDKVLVLELGELKEYASPQSLLEDKASYFYNLARQAGLAEK
jgi:ATP-binding cassette subfamily C (CFTR/MRP) protein 1